MSTDLDTTQAIYLAVVQGVTEFLPISSSGHVTLATEFLGDKVDNLSLNIAVHFGSLLAVIWYFRHQLATMSVDWFRSVVMRKSVGESPLAWAVIWGTVPAGIFGLLLFFVYGDHIKLGIIWMSIVTVLVTLGLLYFLIKRNKEVVKYLTLSMLAMGVLTALAFTFKNDLRGSGAIVITTLLFGLLLFVADRVGKQQREIKSVAWKDVLLIGIAQAIAIIPGTSRSGITITMALFLGFRRGAAARFSFLLSIPTILLAAGVLLIKLVKSDEKVNWVTLGIGALVSAVTAYAVIYLFLKLIERIGMMPFVVYRIVLAIVLIYLIAIGVLSWGNVS